MSDTKNGSWNTEKGLMAEKQDLFICECGCDSFIYVDGIFRCYKCCNEFKIPNSVNGDRETWMRRLNIETGEYSENWEHCPSEGFGGWTGNLTMPQVS